MEISATPANVRDEKKWLTWLINAWSLFKRSVVGAFHHVSTKHLDAYFDEFEWRFNNRNNHFLFRDTLCKLLSSPRL